MNVKLRLTIIMLMISSKIVFGQIITDTVEVKSIDTTQLIKEYTSLDEALLNPENVVRLNLSNQNISVSTIDWSKFTNLTYLSFKNDHLKEIPMGIGSLKYLKILDLTGNDFQMLPSTMSRLVNLEELFLNDDKYFKLDANINTLSMLPNLRILHLENDHLQSLPKQIKSLTHLEMLYLNNNDFNTLPTEVLDLKNLKYLDLQNNRIDSYDLQKYQNQGFGVKINF